MVSNQQQDQCKANNQNLFQRAWGPQGENSAGSSIRSNFKEHEAHKVRTNAIAPREPSKPSRIMVETQRDKKPEDTSTRIGNKLALPMSRFQVGWTSCKTLFQGALWGQVTWYPQDKHWQDNKQSMTTFQLGWRLLIDNHTLHKSLDTLQDKHWQDNEHSKSMFQYWWRQ